MSATAHGPETRNGVFLVANSEMAFLSSTAVRQGAVALLADRADELTRRDRAGGVDADLGRVGVAIGVRFEERAAAGREDGIDVIGVTGLADLERHRVGDAVLADLGLALADEVFHRRRAGIDHVGVAEQGDVLDRVRDAVQRAVEGHALDGQRVEAAGVGADDRVDRAVGDQVADGVMRPHDDVRRRARLAGGQERRDDVLGDRLDDDLDAVLLAVLVGQRLEGRGALVVRPDHEVGVARDDGRGRARGRAWRPTVPPRLPPTRRPMPLPRRPRTAPQRMPRCWERHSSRHCCTPRR